MKVIISSIVLAFAIGGLAAFVLGTIQKPADVAFATSGTRVGLSTTTHMVGPNWTGLDDKE
ncbi:hypothetical protein [Beijerinckia sp. L45]|uniref:hypothetical protein n=1 Tax=Beijerinckia sp. L45 TaxID=1641855 RepID=UPI00131C922A|nr:hypothetical protein [Beijerinckia sp. L45]